MPSVSAVGVLFSDNRYDALPMGSTSVVPPLANTNVPVNPPDPLGKLINVY